MGQYFNDIFKSVWSVLVGMNITFKHLLLPVYAGAYRYNNKVFQVVVNGRTGEVQGERPYSWLKIGCLTIAIIVVILFIVMLAAIFRNV